MKSNLQTLHFLKKKKTEPCSAEKKGLNTFANNTFANNVNLHLPAQAMDLMNPQFGNILSV